jgi:hypothetical protein
VFPRTGGIRVFTMAAALACLVAGLTAGVAGTASAATQAHAATSAALTLTNPGTYHSEPNSTVSLTIKYSDTSNTAVTQDFSATGLPPGLAIDSATGLISGTTNSTITDYDVTVSDTDSAGNTASVQFTWLVENDIAVSAPNRDYTVDTLVPENLLSLVSASDSGGSGLPLSFSASGLPAGLSLVTVNSTARYITGTPTTVGSGNATITVTDGTGSVGTVTFSWYVDMSLNISSQQTTAGQTVALPVNAIDNDPSAQLSLTAEGLPPGLRLDGSEITGWPTTAGTYSAAVEGNDGVTQPVITQFTWDVKAAPDSGPNGPVRLNLDGKCLDDTGNSAANGNKIQIWTCNGGAAQKWTYAEDGTLRINGKCLDITGRSTSQGAKVQLWSCTGAANQQWIPGSDSTLVNPVSGKCLDDSGQSTKNGTQPDIWACGDVAWREWTIPAGSVLSADAGKCLDDASGSTANGNKIDVSTCSGADAQKWTFEPDGTIRVSGKCLDDTGDGSATGTKVQLWSCITGDASQKWTVATASGSLGAELKHGSLCASPASLTSANSTQITLGTCGTDESYWHTW